jgi:hypothetical protein
MRIRKAEAHEKKNYTGINPLFGFVKVRGALGGVKTSWQCAVEYLGEGPDEPNYEVIAPTGMIFAPDGTHTLLGVTQSDLVNRIGELEAEAQ